MFQQEQVTLQNASSWRTGKLTSLLTLLLLLAVVSPRLAAQTNEWTWMGGSNLTTQPGVYGTLGVPAAGNVPGGRYGAVSWTDSSGNVWLFGGWGADTTGSSGFLNDLWKYTPATGEWTWMSGSDSNSYDYGAYGTKGVPAANNVPGGRYASVSWTDASGNLWLFGGGGYAANGSGEWLNDLWKYTPPTGEWTWMSGSNATDQSGVYGTKGVPAAGRVPGARYGAASWTDSSGNLWLFGGVDLNESFLNDLWKYTPSTGLWTWMSGSYLTNQPGVYGTLGVPAAGNVPGGRTAAFSWTDSSSNLWLFGGSGYQGNSNDLWKYTPSTGEWTWMNGSNTFDQPSVYGTQGVPAPGNVPGARSGAVSWTDASGNFWLFGGSDTFVDPYQKFNDLWRYTPSTGEWTWMSGSDLCCQPGVYGTLGVPAAGNGPGARDFSAAWTDSSGNLWLFGGEVYIGNGDYGWLNDLWRYTAPPSSTPSLTSPAPGSTLSGSTATFAWSNPGNIATQFMFRLGTTGIGSSDVFNGAATTGTSVQVSGIPTNGAYLYARLLYYVNGNWQYVDANYTEAGTPTPPALTTPEPGSTLSGSTVTFAWSNPGNVATQFILQLGTTGIGSSDVYSGAATAGTSVQVSGIPANGAYLYARLFYFLNGNWRYVDAVYTEASTFSLSSSQNPASSGQNITLTAQVSPAPAHATIVFYDHNTVLGTAALTGGIASLNVSTLLPGRHDLAAAYNYGSGAHISPVLVQSVQFPAETITLTSSLNPAAAGQTVTLTTTMAPAWPGTVYFYDGNTLLGSAALSGGSASLSTSALAPGVHRVGAAYEIYGALIYAPLLLQNITAP
jgi:N-acetylneuraminic acid mutarotase